MKNITNIQLETLEYYWNYFRENQFFPTLRDIASKFRITHNAVYCRFQHMVKKKVVENKSGHYIITDKGKEILSELNRID